MCVLSLRGAYEHLPSIGIKLAQPAVSIISQWAGSRLECYCRSPVPDTVRRRPRSAGFTPTGARAAAAAGASRPCFSCGQTPLQLEPSVCLSARLCVCLSVAGARAVAARRPSSRKAEPAALRRRPKYTYLTALELEAGIVMRPNSHIHWLSESGGSCAC